MPFIRRGLTMTTSLLALTSFIGMGTAAHAAQMDDGDGYRPCVITNQGNHNENSYQSCGQILTGTGHVTGDNHTIGSGAPGRPNSLPQVGVTPTNLLSAPQDNADVVAFLPGGSDVSAACTVKSPAGDGIFYLVVTTVNNYPTAGWVPAESVQTTADFPECLPD
ncbi:hypothetical protein GCM10010300_56290 [Streptomyces olivaceoviridis]|uniref:hypothetical protein n=1 Tax=Streptomyces olivaceoviridis TaxID=1921 RepID=UPI0016757D82|nr:hypothetical protein [Streptomyces olivaceoviridis]GGZ05081.1 hypothetical protein GCM10010300_56290 [Streptomyces olivaceoviridis]